jgi:hypothetical protein
MNFNELVIQVIESGNVAGGPDSVYGSGASNNSSAFSSDLIYNPNDARIPKGSYPITRRGPITGNKRGKRKKK